MSSEALALLEEQERQIESLQKAVRVSDDMIRQQAGMIGRLQSELTKVYAAYEAQRDYANKLKAAWEARKETCLVLEKVNQEHAKQLQRRSQQPTVVWQGNGYTKPPVRIKKTIKRDGQNRISEVIEEPYAD